MNKTHCEDSGARLDKPIETRKAREFWIKPETEETIPRIYTSKPNYKDYIHVREVDPHRDVLFDRMLSCLKVDMAVRDDENSNLVRVDYCTLRELISKAEMSKS